LYAAVEPITGRVFWLILPTLDAEMTQLFIDEFARAHATSGKQIILVWDGAPAHRAQCLNIPEGITIVPLPAYTPELNPSERLWPLVKEGVANRAHDSVDDLMEQVSSRCQKLNQKPAQISALTNYHWWPLTSSP
jgi:transposase